MTEILILSAGLALLYFGALWLVKGSSAIALRAGVPSLVVGLTVVAFGTSAPELAVSIKSGFDGNGAIALGNVVGSNIFNVAVILGLSALIRPLKVHLKVLRIDTPLMVLISVVIWFLLRDRMISRLEGALLFSGVVLFTYLTIRLAKNDLSSGGGAGVTTPVVVSARRDDAAGLPVSGSQKSITGEILFVLLGLVALVAGSRFFVTGAVDLAGRYGMSDALIGLTIVAAGTSLPELATSLVAAGKGEVDIAVGNIIGSNIFNLLAILGISGMLTPLSSAGIGTVDLAFMTGTAVLLLPLMWTGFRIVRLEGVLLLGIYAGYLWYLWP